MPSLTDVRELLLTACAASLSISIFLCLFRAVLGPRTMDRLIAANAMGAKIIVLLSTISLMTGSGWFVDVSLIYAAMSFLGTVVLTNGIIGREGARAVDGEASP